MALESKIGKQGEAAKSNFYGYLRTQKKLLLIGVSVSAFLFIALKFCFPLPDFFVDSYTYVADAILNLGVGYRPRGYSDFLRMIHSVSPAANFTVTVQYLLFFFSSIFCFFSCDYLFSLPEKLRTLIFFLLLINPLLIFQTNLISSDSLFCSLTVTWFTLCLWIIKKHNWLAVVLQVAVLFLCFYIRYTAIFYPVVAIAGFVFSRGKLLYKVAGILVTIGVIYFSIEQQKDKAEEVTKVRTSSGFSGWQIANNVLCYYRETDVDPADLPSDECRIVDRFVKRFIDSIYEDNYVSTKYIWDRKSPLRRYISTRIHFSGNPYCIEWYAASETLSEYGWAIVRHNPMAYARYFMGPNLKYFLFPEREALENYNNWDSPVPQETKDWFGFNFDHLSCRFPGLQRPVIFLYPMLFLILNLVNITLIIASIYRYGRVWRKIDKDVISLFIFWNIFYFGYTLFCIFSTIVLLRYVDPLFIVGIVMPFVIYHRYKTAEDKLPDEFEKS